MPAEKFYAATKVEGDEPDLTVSWSKDGEEVQINDVVYDDSALDRLITVMRRAKRQTAPLVGEAAIALTAVQEGKDVIIVGPRTAGADLFEAVVQNGRGTWDRVRRALGRESADHQNGGTLRPLTVDGARGHSADIAIVLGWNAWTDKQRASVAAVVATRPGGQIIAA